jgi:hypothetical protein
MTPDVRQKSDKTPLTVIEHMGYSYSVWCLEVRYGFGG